jgi:hypothetical protein
MHIRFPKPTTPQLEQRFSEMLDVSDAFGCPRASIPVNAAEMMQDIKTEHNSVQANIARGLQVIIVLRHFDVCPLIPVLHRRMTTFAITGAQ